MRKVFFYIVWCLKSFSYPCDLPTRSRPSIYEERHQARIANGDKTGFFIIYSIPSWAVVVKVKNVEKRVSYAIPHLSIWYRFSKFLILPLILMLFLPFSHIKFNIELLPALSTSVLYYKPSFCWPYLYVSAFQVLNLLLVLMYRRHSS